MNTDLFAQHAIDRLAKGGINSLSETEKTVATAWLFDAGVTNTGFASYYLSSRGDLAFNAPEALRMIGALELAEIAAKANAVFGSSGPPRNRAARRELVKALPATARHRFAELELRQSRCEEDVDALLDEYLAHASQPA